jgi:hypothetical protein
MGFYALVGSIVYLSSHDGDAVATSLIVTSFVKGCFNLFVAAVNDR